MYLTEKLLGSILQGHFKEVIPQHKIGGYRADFYIVDTNTYVEFDGHMHFTQSITQNRDKNKNRLIREENASLIRIPYFVQLTPQMFKHYFEIDLLPEFVYEYPHGFIDDKAILPLDFNRYGLTLYENILSKLPENVKEEIKKTDKENIQEIANAEFWAEYQRLGGTVIKSFNEYEYFLDLFLKLTGAKIGMDIPLPSHLGFDVFGITLDFYYSYQCGEFNRNRIANDYDIYDIFVASIDNIHPYS